MIYLLTHQREYERPSNTGQLALARYPELVQSVLWQRKRPDANLLQQLQTQQAFVLYPSSDAHSLSTLSPCSSVVILDATWQEAAKMMRQSPYLQAAPKVAIHSAEASQFSLRRNQTAGGLCTIECVIEVLRARAAHSQAEQLCIDFQRFNRR